jgi:hypothetical protein
MGGPAGGAGYRGFCCSIAARSFRRAYIIGALATSCTKQRETSRVNTAITQHIVLKGEAYRLKFHSIPYTLDDLLHDAPVISIRLVITKTHEPPRVVFWVPITLDDPFIPLYTRLFDTRVTFHD